MQLIKRKAIIVALVLVFLFVFSSYVYAQEPTPKYVYFEVADGFPTSRENVIMVNYDKILNPGDHGISGDDHQGLKDSMNLGIRSALSAHKKVWVETEVGGDTIITLYSQALYDGEDYSEAVSNNKYHTTRPTVAYEMYYEGGRKFRTPDEAEFKPIELPVWLDSYSYVQELITESWLVTVVIDEEKLPSGGRLNNNTRLRYVYYDDDVKQRIYATAKPGTDHEEWLFIIPKDEVEMDNGFELKPGDLEIRVGLNYYNQ